MSHVTIAERAFDFYDEDGWTFQYDTKWVNDGVPDPAGADRYPNWWLINRFYDSGGATRVSPPNAARCHYPAGRSGGSTPVSMVKTLTPTHNEIYVRAILQWSRNFQGHNSGINRVFWLKLRNAWGIAFGAWGSGYHDFTPRISLMDLAPQELELAGGTVHLAPTMNTGTLLPRGEWLDIELVARVNTLGNEDGWLKLWVNGTQTHDIATVKLVELADSPLFQGLSIDPIWGGTGDRVRQDMDLFIDHFYASGATV